MVPNLWSTAQNADNPCVSDVSANIPWANVMGTAFANRDQQVNGNWIEIFLTATVETWTHFTQGVTNGDYKGVMTGGGAWLNTPASGEFGDIVIDDERYTLYQIPFIIRFPRTVMVETSFMAAQKITLLTGVVAQD